MGTAKRERPAGPARMRRATTRPPSGADGGDLLREIAEGVRDIPYAMDAAGALTYVGRQALTYGFDPAQLVGRRFTEILSPADRGRVEAEFDRAISEGVEIRSVMRVDTPARGACRFEDVGRVRRDRSGAVVGIVGFLRDATDREQIAAELDRKQRRLAHLNALLGHSPALLFVWRLAGDFPVEYVSDNIARLGYSAEDFTSGRVSWPGITHPEDEPRLREEVANYLKEEGDDYFSQRYRIRAAGGEYRWMRDWNQFIRDDSGRRTHVHAIVLDITDHEAAAAALREREANFRALAENAATGISIRVGERLVFSNRFMCDLLGYSAEEFGLRPATDFFAPGERERFVDLMRRVSSGQAAPSVYQIRMLSRSGEEIPVEIAAADTVWQGEPARIGLIRDIRERLQSEQSLRESEQRLTRAEEIAAFGTWEWMPDTGSVVWSRGMYRLYGVDPAAFVPSAESAATHMPPGELAILTKAVMDAVRRGGAFEYEHRVVRPGGTVALLQTHAMAVAGANGGTRVIGTTRDVTEHRLLEQRVMEITQQEQHRTGRDIHDTLGQLLTGISFLAKTLEWNLSADRSARAGEATALVDLLGQALDQTRRLARGLAPVATMEEGLAAALAALAEDTQSLFGVACSCSFSQPALVHDHAAALQIYQIAREAVTNAVRHASPSRIQIRLETGETARLEIADDGTWRDARSGQGTGMGLRIMHYRAQSVGGALTVAHRRGQPTTVTCCFPNSRPAS